MKWARGVLTISIDYEFAWGLADHPLGPEVRERVAGEIEITERLLALFDKYEVPATWAVVGHLLEKTCLFDGTLPHPEYPRPIHAGESRDWFAGHPPQDDYSDPLWFDSERLILKIIRSNAGHELASHSYAHIIYNAASEEAVRADLRNVENVHQASNLPVRSFIFPRNAEAHHELVKAHGFTSYRGNTVRWYEKLPSILGMVMRRVHYFWPSARTVRPSMGEAGLVNVPESMLLLSRNGLRKLITKGVMRRKLIAGLRAAARRGEVFHLWFHPSNFWYETDTQFELLECVFSEASRLQKEGVLYSMPMGAVADQFLNSQTNA